MSDPRNGRRKRPHSQKSGKAKRATGRGGVPRGKDSRGKLAPEKAAIVKSVAAGDGSTLPIKIGQSAVVRLDARRLTAAEFQGLAVVPPEAEWFANIHNKQTRRAYQNDIKDFTGFVGIKLPAEFRVVTRAHVIAWRKALEDRKLAPATIRRKLSALSALFDHLCDANAITHNPVKGVKRPTAEANEGKTPAIGDGQVRALLDAPPPDTVKGGRDRAILSMFLFHALRGVVQTEGAGICTRGAACNIYESTARAASCVTFPLTPERWSGSTTTSTRWAIAKI